MGLEKDQLEALVMLAVRQDSIDYHAAMGALKLAIDLHMLDVENPKLQSLLDATNHTWLSIRDYFGLMTCFCCGGKLSPRSDGDWNCGGCRRVLYQIDENWATRRTKVKLKKLPKCGDSYNDCIEVVD